jgi:competence protein ComEC
MKSPAFYALFLSFFAGVFAFSFSHTFVMLATTLLFFVALPLSILKFSPETKLRTLVLIFCGAIFLFSLGAARIGLSGASTHPLDSFVGMKSTVSGFVCAEPRPKDVTQSFCFAPVDSDDKVLVTAGKYPQYSYGDELSVTGKIAYPENFEVYEGGPEFDYVSYLAKDGIRYAMFRPQIEKTGEDAGNPVIAALVRIKSAFISQMRDLFPEPESSLLGGLLLGDRQSLPKDVTEEFKRAGLVHVLVLSGYNVTIVAESLMKAFSYFPRSVGRFLGAGSIVLFALMTGAGATTVRASIMALIVILARSTARRYDVSRALIIAAFFMVLHNPRILAFDVSFQLSFLATLAIIYVSPLVAERLVFVTEKWNLREILSTTVATQVFVMPYLLYAMGQLSIISFVSNLFVLPAVPYAMFFGFISTMASFFLGPLVSPLAWAASAILSYIVYAASLFAAFPFASIEIQMSLVGLICIYALFAAVLIRSWRRINCSPRSSS